MLYLVWKLLSCSLWVVYMILWFTNINGVYASRVYSGTIVGCKHRFSISIDITANGLLKFNSTRLFSSNDNNKRYTSDMKHYLFTNITSNRTVKASIVSNDRAFDNILPVYVFTPGKYTASFKLLYNTSNQAYGLDTVQLPEINCNLNDDLNNTISFYLPASTRGITNTGPSWQYIAHLSHIIYNTSRHYIAPKEHTHVHHKPALSGCLCRHHIQFIGDSHTRMVYRTLQKLQLNCNMGFQEDGRGISHNAAPDKDFNAYAEDKIASNYVKGDMLTKLESGVYKQQVLIHNVKTFIIESGHWDLRDTQLEIYENNSIVVFVGFYIRQLFQIQHKVTLIWLGVPPFSHHNHKFHGKERRTNVKLSLADQFLKTACNQRNITHIPFFDIAFPFYSNSCDSHHYLCDMNLANSFVGVAHLNTLLNQICK